MDSVFLQGKMTFFENSLLYNIDEMVVYVDVLFLENLVLDGIIILATSIICHTKLPIKKWALASLVGSLGSTISLVAKYHSWLGKIMLSIGMNWIAFGWKNQKYFMKHC